MDHANLIAIDVHTHAEVSCWNPFDNYGEEYDRAADKYFKSNRRPTIAETVHAIVLDRKQLLPVSSLQNGCYGLRNVCLSVPTVVGRGGAEKHLQLKLWPKEEQALKSSAKALQDMLAQVAR